MKDATAPQIKKEMKQNDFNPRTHIGCDLILRYLIAPFAHFNPRTHIGCDYVIKAFFERKKNFNPRTHIGCDNQYRLKRDLHVEFQSRSEEHTSELQSRGHLVCRLLLAKNNV